MLQSFESPPSISRQKIVAIDSREDQISSSSFWHAVVAASKLAPTGRCRYKFHKSYRGVGDSKTTDIKSWLLGYLFP